MFSNMKKGHKRTQSDTLIYINLQQTYENNLQKSQKQIKLEIPHLLLKSQSKIHHKICNTESLNIRFNDHLDPLFTFGRGFFNKNADIIHQTHAERKFLISIPQKNQQNYLNFEANQLNISKYRNKSKNIFNNQLKQLIKPFHQRTNYHFQNIGSSILNQEQITKKGLFLAHNFQPKYIIKDQ